MLAMAVSGCQQEMSGFPPARRIPPLQMGPETLHGASPSYLQVSQFEAMQAQCIQRAIEHPRMSSVR